jgi:glucuronoarabinoxylan endo-1,4-beta-xylanase
MKLSAGKENTGTLAGSAVTKALKIKWSRVQAAVVIGLILQAGIAAAQNFAANPGFESGNTSGWFAFGTPTISAQTAQVHSGTYAGMVTGRTATYMGMAQSFQGILQSGQTYNVSVWLRLVSGSSQTMQLTMQKTDGSGTGYTSIASGSVSATGWVNFTGQYTPNISGTLTTLTMYAETPNSTNASYYIDDLVVQPANVVSNGQATVDWGTVFQHIDGFGASSAWDSTWTTSQADMFFSTNNGTGTSFDGKTNFPFTGIGLSLLRNHIVPATTTLASATPTTVETSIMQLAQARGARVWSAPWTPASGFKSNGGPNGGNYLGNGNNITNLNYASQLANYVVSMQNTYRVNIYALSIQNEPDANVTYESAVWNGTQIRDFVTNLYSALAAKGVGSTKIILPESQNWAGNPSLWTPTMSDPNAAAAVGIVANHNYVGNNVTGDTSTPANLSVGGKAVWETEVSQIGGSYDGGIANAVYWAGRIHLFMTAAQANAWHYWWLVPSGTDNEALVDTNGIPAKRMYALGQFARFVRPDFYRINIANTSSAQISAYKDSNSPKFAIVAINSGSTSVTQSFILSNVTGVSTVTPWMTTATMSLSNQTPVAVSGSTFSYTLPALSIVTFVGQANPAPAAPTTLMLVSGSNPSTYGDAVNFTATVQTNTVAVGGVVGETVTFYNGATQLGTGTLNGGGQAGYTTTANQLGAGTPAITAVYAGDASYVASTNSPALSQTVNQATLTYTADPASMIYGAAVPSLIGSVSGFVGSDTQGNATTGALTFTTPATSSSPAGAYAINGSGLAANNGNYTFAQAAGNATALNIMPLTTPLFTGQGITVGAGGRQLSFSGQSGQTYQVLATTDLGLPINQWTVVTNGTFGAGTVTITDSSSNAPQRFYQIVSP